MYLESLFRRVFNNVDSVKVTRKKVNRCDLCDNPATTTNVEFFADDGQGSVDLYCFDLCDRCFEKKEDEHGIFSYEEKE